MESAHRMCFILKYKEVPYSVSSFSVACCMQLCGVILDEQLYFLCSSFMLWTEPKQHLL